MLQIADLPGNLVALGIVLQCNGEVTAIIEFAEGGWLGRSLFECPSPRGAGNLGQDKERAVVLCDLHSKYC